MFLWYTLKEKSNIYIFNILIKFIICKKTNFSIDGDEFAGLRGMSNIINFFLIDYFEKLYCLFVLLIIFLK